MGWAIAVLAARRLLNAPGAAALLAVAAAMRVLLFVMRAMFGERIVRGNITRKDEQRAAGQCAKSAATGR
ncbi:MAG: hypothetical protein IT337_07735 [Thermomicrobiales bacterium]|nr:hypothetical protein [Thermomicrobiales bacterium]